MSKETTHIRIDRDLKSMLELQAGPGESVNDVIRRLLTGDPAPVNMSVNKQVNIQDTLYMLTKRIEQLEQDRESIPVQPEVIPAPVQPDDPLITQCSQVGEQTKVQPVNISLPEVNQAQERGKVNTLEEWVMITEDIRSQLVAKITTLQKAGMTYAGIGKVIGMSKGRFTELHQGKLKKMHKSQYDSLLQLQ